MESSPSASQDLLHGNTYINRELSWLSFASRVLEMAEDKTLPLLERVKFAGIMGMLYDEFAMKRLGGLRNELQKNPDTLAPDGRTPGEEIVACRQELQRQAARVCHLVQDELRPALWREGIPICDYQDLSPGQQEAVNAYYQDSVEPILTPLAVDAGHPFPFISNLGLNLAVTGTHREGGRACFIRVKVPSNRPRWVAVPGWGGVVPLEQVIAANIAQFFPDIDNLSTYSFRVTRAAKDNPWDRVCFDEHEPELQPGCIIGMVTAELTYRKFAGATRLQVSADMPLALQRWLADQLDMDVADILPVQGLMALADLMKFSVEGRPELRDRPFTPVTHPRLRGLERHDAERFFGEIRQGDILIHLPYHSFDTSILRFLQHAASDPAVLAIKLTIYRTSSQSPIMQALMEAAGRGKQVAVMVEITARFDEAPNIAWGEKLERAGVHVIYGMERLKTHVKLALVVREEADGIRRYFHVSTGNYNARTARLYEDLGILSADPQLGRNIGALFNELTGAISSKGYDMLMVAPHNLRERFTQLIQREVEHSRQGRPCGIRAKMNQLQDLEMIDALYRASQAGVPIALNVRGLCCLRAGVPGLSENIRVSCTLGRYLEHARIYRFENGGEPELFIGSADWMKRNLDRRMETIAPVLDAAIKRELEHILDVLEQDNCSAWDMLPDAGYRRRMPAEGEERRPAQDVFMREAAGS